MRRQQHWQQCVAFVSANQICLRELRIGRTVASDSTYLLPTTEKVLATAAAAAKPEPSAEIQTHKTQQAAS